MMLRTRINIVAASVTLLVAITLIVTSRISQNEVEQRYRDEAITGKSVLWSKIIAAQTDHMQSATASLARDRDTLGALKESDTELLAENAVTTYNMLSAGKVITKLQIANKDGEVLYSAPNDFQGASNKKVLSQALSEGEIVRGVERDDDGEVVGD